MAAEKVADPQIEGISAALAEWRQGDCVLGQQWFVYKVDCKLAVTEAGKAVVAAAMDLVEVEVLGFAVVTQTCDIVRSCEQRPFIEVCPLISVDDEELRNIEKGRRPAYAYLPGLVEKALVVDLDRVMTVEKPLVATWGRVPGWQTDAEGRAFAKALGRKRQRFAFPDDFNALVHELQRRLIGKHEKNSDEGRALRALREIRVQASPSWDAGEVRIFIWFIRDEQDEDFEGQRWDEYLELWLGMTPESGRFVEVDGQVATLQDMTADDYVSSDPLDLDNLSTASNHR